MPVCQSFLIIQQQSPNGKLFNPMPSIATGLENVNFGGVVLRSPRYIDFTRMPKNCDIWEWLWAKKNIFPKS